jgi:hypothetical protein
MRPENRRALDEYRNSGKTRMGPECDPGCDRLTYTNDHSRTQHYVTVRPVLSPE